MKVGVIGSGDVGRRLADGFIGIQSDVMLATRDPQQPKIKEWLSTHKSHAQIGTSKETSQFGELLVVALPWNGINQGLQASNPDNFSGKVVIDVTNPLDFSGGMPPKMASGFDNSSGELVQKLLPTAKVVKALNTIGNPHMINPDFPKGSPTMFICGNQDESKSTVADLLRQFGWEDIIDIGDITGSRLLEPLAMLWITYAFKYNSMDHAFKLLKK